MMWLIIYSQCIPNFAIRHAFLYETTKNWETIDFKALEGMPKLINSNDKTHSLKVNVASLNEAY